jgi:hypothetical protein
MRQGFDNAKYIELQAAHIKERISQFGGKLYLEFGGKLFDDYHASRVLPGFEPDSKFRMLKSIADDVEVIIATISRRTRPVATWVLPMMKTSCAWSICSEGMDLPLPPWSSRSMPASPLPMSSAIV